VNTKHGSNRYFARAQPPSGGNGGVAFVQTMSRYNANDAQIPAAAGAAVSSRNGHPLVAFDDSDDESCIFNDTMNEDYVTTRTLDVIIQWAAAPVAVVGDVKWNVEWERIAPGGQDLDVDGFAAAKTVTTTTSATNGVTVSSTISFTQAEADGIDTGDAFRLRVTRDADDGGDTLIGDAQVLAVYIIQT